MKQLIILFLLIFNLNIISASYISGDLYISDSGICEFNVRTDSSLNISGLEKIGDKIIGKTDLLTSKNKGVWEFSFNSQNYSNVLIDVHLPKSIKSINYIEGASFIDLESKIINIIENNKNINLKVGYTLKDENDSTIYFLIILMVLIILLFLSFLIIKRKKDGKRLDYILPLINDKEKDIIKLLMKKPLRQKEIRKILDIPKASYSRYLYNLEKKKLILREGLGKNRIIKLK